MIYWYRDKQQKEIDLLIEKNGKLHPIEIKLTSNPNKSMIKNFSILEYTTQGALICTKEKDMLLTENVSIIPVSYI